MEVRSPPNPHGTLECEQTIGYFFQDKLLLFEALQADGSPICSEEIPRYHEGNRRLAVVGDLVLSLLAAAEWYPTWNAEGESVFKKERSDEVVRTALDSVGRDIELHRHLTPCAKTGFDAETMSKAVKAIVGAAYLDGGIDAANWVVQKLRIDVYGDTPAPDAKST
ncbi:MAG: hypothetical protein Q9223_001962 [Gallowayella weberi]